MTANQEPVTPTGNHVEQVQKLFLRHADRLRGYLVAVCPDLSLVDDLLHTIFLCVVAKAEQFDPQRSFLAWARGIAKNELRRLSRNQKYAPHMLNPDVVDQLLVPDDLFQTDSDQLAALVACVEELAPRARQAIVLRYLEQLLPGQIADRMGLAIDSVHVMLSRGRVALRECVEARLGQPTTGAKVQARKIQRESY